MCGEYNFSLATIEPSEFIVKSELRLFLNKVSSSSSSSLYVVEVKAHLSSGQVLQGLKILIDFGTGGRYFMFHVEKLIESLIRRGIACL